MSEELKRHLRRLTWYTWGFFLSILPCFILGLFSLILIFIDLKTALCVLLPFLLFLFLALLCWKKGKAYGNSRTFGPIHFTLSEPYSYDDVLAEFSTSAGEKYSLKCSEDSAFFKLGRNPVTRTLVLRMATFDNKIFKQMKNSANQKVTRAYPDTPWTGSFAHKKYPQRIYLNIIYAEELTDALQELISKNVSDSPGNVNAVFCPDRIYLPPLFPPTRGMISLYEISSYKTVIIIFRALFSIS